MSRRLILSCLLLLASATDLAAQYEFFPMNTGNLWIYRATGARKVPLVLAITQSSQFNGKTYFRLHGLPQHDYWIRSDGNGTVLAYDPETNVETVWYKFAN